MNTNLENENSTEVTFKKKVDVILTELYQVKNTLDKLIAKLEAEPSSFNKEDFIKFTTLRKFTETNPWFTGNTQDRIDSEFNSVLDHYVRTMELQLNLDYLEIIEYIEKFYTFYEKDFKKHNAHYKNKDQLLSLALFKFERKILDSIKLSEKQKGKLVLDLREAINDRSLASINKSAEPKKVKMKI